MSTIINQKPRQRRFESLPTPGSYFVTPLAEDHDAILSQQPLFPTRVVHANDVKNIFVSGQNNRKIGRVITKGSWKGMPIFMLTLPERSTCSTACHLYRTCYGNAMHMANRIMPGVALEERIERDIETLAEKHPKGFVVRLHILGDFYSVNYVRLWHALLIRHPKLHIYGYTARGMEKRGDDKLIAAAIENTKESFPNRFAIRWSRPKPGEDTVTVITAAEEADELRGVVCPAETSSSECCATCGLCWEPRLRSKTVHFLLHGKGSSRTKATARAINNKGGEATRRIQPIDYLAEMAKAPIGKPPRMIWVRPTDIWVESSYQRNLTARTVRHIGRIVREFDWHKFTPPACVQVGDQYYAYDGQHTAIASASHPLITEIPILVCFVPNEAERAKLFVSKNWDRVAPTPLQRFVADVAAGNPGAILVKETADEAGVKILAYPPQNGVFKPGETLALKTIQTTLRRFGKHPTVATLKVMIRAEQVPIRAYVLTAASSLLFGEEYRGSVSEEGLVMALKACPYEKSLNRAREYAEQFDISRAQGLAMVYHKYITGAE